MQTIYINGVYGHSYYFKMIQLFAAPTLKDGTPDYENELNVNDFDIPLTEQENTDIMSQLEEAHDNPESDKEPTARYYSAAGILEVQNFKPVIENNELMNESEFFDAVEAQTENEAIPGDIVTVTYVNYATTKATVYAYIINANFMGSYDISFYGKRTHDIN